MGDRSDGYFQHMFKKVSSAIKAAGTERRVSEAFALCKTNEERVAFLLQSPLIRPALGIPPAAASPTSFVEARCLREAGNKLFNEKKYHAAVEKYNASILSCPREPADKAGDACECLALSYSNRSAAWYHLHDYRSSLSDIEAAVRTGYPVRMAHKLHIRKARCLVGMLDYSGAGEAAAAAEKSLSCSDLSTSEKEMVRCTLHDLVKGCGGIAATATAIASAADDVSPSPLTHPATSVPAPSYGPNDAYPSLSSIVDVQSSQRQGRHIVANRPVKVGDIILTEEPFASVLSPSCLETHCYGCLKRLNVFYPCRRCNSARYCSLECETDSWTRYHQFECANIEALTGCGISMGLLALRAVLVGGLTYYIARVKSSNGKFNGSVDTDARAYGDVFHLESHESDRTPVDLFWRSLAAVFLALCVCSKASSLLPVYETSTDSLLQDIAALTLHHLQVFPCNAHEISELRGVEGNMESSELIEIGSGIYFSLSLFNHSCDPCVTRTFHGRTAVVRCIRPLTAGEQAYDNYGVVYATHTLPERQAKLKNQYYFDCACDACIGKWPLYAALAAVQCRPHFRPCSHGRVPASSVAQCDVCDASVSHINAELGDSLALVCSGVINEDIVGKLSAYLAALYGHVLKPYKSFNDCEEALKHCFNRMGNCTVLPAAK